MNKAKCILVSASLVAIAMGVAGKDNEVLVDRSGGSNPSSKTFNVETAEKDLAQDVKIGGVRVVWYADQKGGIQPFGQPYPSYSLSLIATLPESIQEVTGGKIKEAITDRGQNLVSMLRGAGEINFPRIAKDRKTVEFTIDLILPNKDAKSLRKVSGTLEYLTAGSSKQVDLGIVNFRKGSRGKEYGAIIRSIARDEWDEELTTLKLKLKLSRVMINSVKFYTEEGKELEVSQSGYESFNDMTTFEFSTEGKFPPKGKIVVNVAEKLEKHELPFRITAVSLIGIPFDKPSIERDMIKITPKAGK